jgi:hypothetical protein
VSGSRVAKLRRAFNARSWVGWVEFIQNSGMKTTTKREMGDAQRAYRAKHPTWRQFKADYMRRKAAT